jgi:cytochrome P450
VTNPSCLFAIDPTGRDIHGEAALLREKGPVTRVELPGGVPAWSVTDQALAKWLLTDARVSRDAYRHWPAWENGEGELARSWPLAIWVQDRNMITAYGEAHTRLRRTVRGDRGNGRVADGNPAVAGRSGRRVPRRWWRCTWRPTRSGRASATSPWPAASP